jgi:hypothetical protein
MESLSASSTVCAVGKRQVAYQYAQLDKGMAGDDKDN